MKRSLQVRFTYNLSEAIIKVLRWTSSRFFITLQYNYFICYLHCSLLHAPEQSAVVSDTYKILSVINCNSFNTFYVLQYAPVSIVIRREKEKLIKISGEDKEVVEVIPLTVGIYNLNIRFNTHALIVLYFTKFKTIFKSNLCNKITNCTQTLLFLY